MNKKQVASTIGMIIGTIVIMFGAIFLTIKPSSDEDLGWTGTAESYEFGADFYTEEYNCSMLAANNTNAIVNYIHTGIGLGLLAVGMTDFGAFLYTFMNSFDDIKEDKNE